jgi:hypothetical protein
MSETPSQIEQNNINYGKLQKEDILRLIKLFQEWQNSGVLNSFNIDWKEELSEDEKIILEKLGKVELKIWYLENLVIQIDKLKTSEQEKNEAEVIPPNLLNKELKEFSQEEAKVWLKYLQDNYQNYTRPWIVDWIINDNTKINEIKDNHDAHLFQKELVKKIDPLLFKIWHTNTHIRWFNLAKWESIISIDDFNTKLDNPNTKILWDEYSENVISYIEMKRYLSFIKDQEWENFDFDFEEENDEKNKKVLEKYLPKHILDNFLTDRRKKIKKYDMEESIWTTNDEIKEWEYDIIVDSLTSEDEKLVNLLIKDWYTVKEIEKIITDKNIDIKLKLEKYRTKHKEYYETEKKELELEKKKEEELKNNKKNNQNVSKQAPNNSSENNYTKSGNWYIMKTPRWEEIRISEEEKKLTTWNPEATENLINFYNILNELWLKNLWDYRSTISTAIWSISWSTLNYNDDSLWENELKIFLNSILLSVWKKEIDKYKNIDEFKNLFKIQNDFQIIWDWYKNDGNKKWDSSIEEAFMQKYILGFSKFQSENFKKDIQKKNW